MRADWVVNEIERERRIGPVPKVVQHSNGADAVLKHPVAALGVDVLFEIARE